jgi:hypothetical protein
VRVAELSFCMSCLKLVHTEEEVEEMILMNGEFFHFNVGFRLG